ncbi:hypothetical protein LTR53_019194, partial [Teratosphaeriaceae sp. CCFEE 6253]
PRLGNVRHHRRCGPPGHRRRARQPPGDLHRHQARRGQQRPLVASGQRHQGLNPDAVPPHLPRPQDPRRVLRAPRHVGPGDALGRPRRHAPLHARGQTVGPGDPGPLPQRAEVLGLGRLHQHRAGLPGAAPAHPCDRRAASPAQAEGDHAHGLPARLL